jgi:hypothetical protein
MFLNQLNLPSPAARLPAHPLGLVVPADDVEVSASSVTGEVRGPNSCTRTLRAVKRAGASSTSEEEETEFLWDA